MRPIRHMPCTCMYRTSNYLSFSLCIERHTHHPNIRCPSNAMLDESGRIHWRSIEDALNDENSAFRSVIDRSCMKGAWSVRLYSVQKEAAVSSRNTEKTRLDWASEKGGQLFVSHVSVCMIYLVNHRGSGEMNMKDFSLLLISLYLHAWTCLY